MRANRSRPRIFVTQPVARSAIDRLRKVATVTVNPDSSRILPKRQLIAAVRKCDILFSLLHDKVDSEVIAALASEASGQRGHSMVRAHSASKDARKRADDTRPEPGSSARAANPKLSAIASQAITPDNIDVAEATRRKIPVTVTPPIVAEATADINFGLMLMVARRMVEGDGLVHKGRFPGSQSSHLAGAAVYGKTIGLVGGGGRIGSAVARRARGFGMRVLYWAPRRKPESLEREHDMTYVPLDQLLAESDFVSLHSPLNAETRHQIGKRELELMKPTAFLINTARGAIVDEAALARALKKRQIAGAGLDVFEHEPDVTPALLKMPNVVATPHLGSAVVEVREQMANIVVDNILALLDGKTPPNCVNPEVLQG
jgi:glyoxylate reductase